MTKIETQENLYPQKTDYIFCYIHFINNYELINNCCLSYLILKGRVWPRLLFKMEACLGVEKELHKVTQKLQTTSDITSTRLQTLIDTAVLLKTKILESKS